MCLGCLLACLSTFYFPFFDMPHGHILKREDFLDSVNPLSIPRPPKLIFFKDLYLYLLCLHENL